jgi:hypothetical protein
MYWLTGLSYFGDAPDALNLIVNKDTVIAAGISSMYIIK